MNPGSIHLEQLNSLLLQLGKQGSNNSWSLQYHGRKASVHFFIATRTYEM